MFPGNEIKLFEDLEIITLLCFKYISSCNNHSRMLCNSPQAMLSYSSQRASQYDAVADNLLENNGRLK